MEETQKEIKLKQVLMVGSSEAEHYVSSFRWDDTKYPLKQSCKDIAASIAKVFFFFLFFFFLFFCFLFCFGLVWFGLVCFVLFCFVLFCFVLFSLFLLSFSLFDTFLSLPTGLW